MGDNDTGAPSPETVAIERWQYDNPSWLVIVVHPVISPALGGKVVEELEVKVEHRETGVVLSGTGTNVAMALAMINHLISERF